MSGDPLDPCNAREFREAHGPRFTLDGKQLAAGEMGRFARVTVYDGPMPAQGVDRALDAPKRPCAKCGESFQPTERRRLLCAPCFGRAGSAVDAGAW